MDAATKHYAETVLQRYIGESVDLLGRERAAFLNRIAAQKRSANIPMSGIDYQVMARLYAEHVERCMRAALKSYHEAFDQVAANPTDQDLIEIWNEILVNKSAQIRNSVQALQGFMSSSPVKLNAAETLEAMSGRGHDRVLQEWKVWRARVRLKGSGGGKDASSIIISVPAGKSGTAGHSGVARPDPAAVTSHSVGSKGVTFFRALVASAALALVVALVSAALAAGGVISGSAVRIWLFLAWVFGCAGIVLSEVVLGQKRRHRIAIGVSTAVLWGIFLVGLNSWIIAHGPAPQEISPVVLYQNKRVEIYNNGRANFYLWGSVYGDLPVSVDKEPRLIVPGTYYYLFADDLEKQMIDHLKNGQEGFTPYFAFITTEDSKKHTIKCHLIGRVSDNAVTIHTQTIGVADGWVTK